MVLRVLNLAIGCTSLYIQMMVLIPWHNQISKQINDLSKKK